MEDAGALEVVRACEEALERSVDDARFVLFHSPSVDSLCAVKILLTAFKWAAPEEPTVRMVTTLQSLKDAVAGEQQSGPRVLFFINCGGLTHEFDELEFCEGGVTIIMDHRRPMANNTGLIGADVRWMTLTDDQGALLGTPASLCALYVAQALYLKNEVLVWYAILGETDLAQEPSATAEQVKNWEHHLMGHVQCDDSCGISHDTHLRLPFFQHTSLWESIHMSGAIMAKTGAWKMHDDQELIEFVVELGIPMEKSKIPYGSFMLKYGHDLKEKLCDRGPQWGLHDLCTACFKKNTAMGEMSAEDHARAVRSTLAACSGQCDPLTILRATQVALEVLSGEGDCLKRAAAQHEKLMPSITRPCNQGIRIWNLDKRHQGADKSPHWKCPFWLEIIAQHAMDYSDVPVVLVGQEMDDGRVAVVGWGNCEGENGSIQQPITQLMLETGVSMQLEGHDLESVAFQPNIWWMRKKTAREYVNRVKKMQGSKSELQKTGHKRQADVAEDMTYKKNRTVLKGRA